MIGLKSMRQYDEPAWLCTLDVQAEQRIALLVLHGEGQDFVGGKVAFLIVVAALLLGVYVRVYDIARCIIGDGNESKSPPSASPAPLRTHMHTTDRKSVV